MSHPRPAYGRPDGGLRRTRPKQPSVEKPKSEPGPPKFPERRDLIASLCRRLACEHMDGTGRWSQAAFAAWELMSDIRDANRR